jgi:hypothetical protein
MEITVDPIIGSSPISASTELVLKLRSLLESNTTLQLGIT